jgi:hypothetical protein
VTKSAIGPTGLSARVRRRARIRALRDQRNSELRDVAKLAAELRRAGSPREDLVELRFEKIVSIDDELFALQRGAAATPAARPDPVEKNASSSTIDKWAFGALVLGATIAVSLVVALLWPKSHTPERPAASTSAATPVPSPATPSTPAASRTPASGPSAKPRRSPAGRSVRPSAKKLTDQTLATGSTGADVRLVQRLLHVSETGSYDKVTEAAVKRFQGKHDVKTTGVVSKQTHIELKRAFP